MRKVVTAAMAVGLLAGLSPAAASAAPAPPGFDPTPIQWGQCSDEDLQKAGAECGMLQVPMDYADPAGEQISLAVSRIKHTVPDDQYQGVMLVNPGGPGGSGLSLSTLGAYVPKGAGAAYDWIGFDPRGVGSSLPAISCDPNYFSYDRPNYVPTTPELEKTWLDRSEGYARACGNNGKLLEHVKTTDTVEDMDSIRKALGADQINYYGFSYGTYLGQVYGTLHPDRMRRVVMDGVVNVEDVWYDANLNQDVAFDRNIKIFFDWVAEHDDVYHLGKTGADVEKLFYEQQAALDKEPAGGVIGPDEWVDVFLTAGYSQSAWDSRAKAFAGWVHNGDWETLKKIYDGSNTPGDDNGFAVYLAVQCTDVKWPQSWEQWRQDSWDIHEKAPFETWSNTWYNAPCLSWPAKPGKPVEVDGSKVDSALLISEELDAATPFPGALEARKRFPGASLISLPGGTTHSGSLSGNTCLDDQIADYLATGKLPPRQPGNGPDTKCDPLPKPTPETGPTTMTTKRSQQPEALQKALQSTWH
ncbi:alpha/beta hydrolase [Saccharopolyspora sp. WRP15-2]|uniref:Alpha/beta hydrolase n=1 Tax=Saccharopolyspora oryzae TaxID=2997343 RepID=A0ABT4URN7_9PSEU|nr:alpha/beta hydrolase [Saccharopolyspora oryzae]MDA3624381.1 alpha/beta hydrolase [Saccharopolyspora oryzae]